MLASYFLSIFTNYLYDVTSKNKKLHYGQQKQLKEVAQTLWVIKSNLTSFVEFRRMVASWELLFTTALTFLKEATTDIGTVLKQKRA